MSEYNVAQLKTSLGTVKLLKGTRLYYYGYNYPSRGFSLSEKFFLRTFFHPSDKPCKTSDDVITVIELQKDITLIFMINKIIGSLICSYVDQYLDMYNLEKKPEPPETKRIVVDNKLVEEWQKEGLGGWISAVSNHYVDVVIFNDPNIHKIVECNQTGYNNVFKMWFIGYSNSLVDYPPEMVLNIQYKKQIDEYLEERKDFEEKYITSFGHLLRNSKISYIDTPFVKVKWNSTIVEYISLSDYCDRFNTKVVI